jgi:hypothetical protein
LIARISWLAAFGIAFGVVEGAVVVYLRAIYYPQGFGFPLVLPADRLLIMELVREVATLVMLAAVARTSGRGGWDRFGVFCLLFGIWDLIYYLVLWIALGWPETLMTWDVLFLLPLIWVGPVLSAVLIAISLVLAGGMLLRADSQGLTPRPDRWVWAGAGAALLLLLGSFMWLHGMVRAGEVPARFPWIPYGAGFGLGWVVFLRAFRRRA